MADIGQAADCATMGVMEHLTLELEREDDGRWIAEISELPGVMAYGATEREAMDRAKALALRVLAERLEHGEVVPELRQVFSVAR